MSPEDEKILRTFDTVRELKIYIDALTAEDGSSVELRGADYNQFTKNPNCLNYWLTLENTHKTARVLNHPNMVYALEQFQEENQPYIQKILEIFGVEKQGFEEFLVPESQLSAVVLYWNNKKASAATFEQDIPEAVKQAHQECITELGFEHTDDMLLFDALVEKYTVLCEKRTLQKELPHFLLEEGMQKKVVLKI